METHGHEPKARRMSDKPIPPRSYIDGAVSLPAGRLVKFILYSHKINGKIGLVLETRFLV